MVRSCPDPVWGKTIISTWSDAIFFPRVVLDTFCSFLLIYGGLGLGLSFRSLDLHLIGLLACVAGPSGFSRVLLRL